MKLKPPLSSVINDKGLRRTALALAAFLLADVLVYFLLLSPLAERLASAEGSLAAFRKRHAEAVLFKKQKDQFAGIVAGVPAQQDMPLLVKEFVQTARGLDLRVAAVNYDMPRPGGEALATLVFSFPVEGRYAGIKRFIYDVETSARNVGIQDLKLEADKGMVKVNLKLMTYVKGQ